MLVVEYRKLADFKTNWMDKFIWNKKNNKSLLYLYTLTKCSLSSNIPAFRKFLNYNMIQKYVYCMNICIYTCSLSPCILVYNHFMSKLDIWCVQHFTFHRKINYSYNIPLLISEVLRHMKKKVSGLLSSATNMFTSTYIKKIHWSQM